MSATFPHLLRVGLTARMCDHWTRRGYLKAETTHPGSGRARTWPWSEVRVAELTLRLIRAGLTLDDANRAARSITSAGAVDGRAELAPGVWIEVGRS